MIAVAPEDRDVGLALAIRRLFARTADPAQIDAVNRFFSVSLNWQMPVLSTKEPVTVWLMREMLTIYQRMKPLAGLPLAYLALAQTGVLLSPAGYSFEDSPTDGVHVRSRNRLMYAYGCKNAHELHDVLARLWSIEDAQIVVLPDSKEVIANADRAIARFLEFDK